MQWPSDLIGYNALSSYGSPSYWVQVMFSGHLGTEVVSSTLANAATRVYESVTRDEKQRKLFIKVVNGTSDAQPLSIDIQGAGKISSPAKLVTLSGKTPNATNSIANPNALAPVESSIAVAGPKFKQTFAPYSINVLELSY
jgi:alpha-N-arabinofuranosidase